MHKLIVIQLIRMINIKFFLTWRTEICITDKIFGNKIRKKIKHFGNENLTLKMAIFLFRPCRRVGLSGLSAWPAGGRRAREGLHRQTTCRLVGVSTYRRVGVSACTSACRHVHCVMPVVVVYRDGEYPVLRLRSIPRYWLRLRR